MRSVIIGYMQVDILNKDNLGINGDSYFKSQIQDFISNHMTDANNYLHSIYVAHSNGQTVDDYNKTKFSKTITNPFCMENTNGYAIDLELFKQAPIPRYLLKTTNFDLFENQLEVRTYRVAGEPMAYIVDKMPTFNSMLSTNFATGVVEYEIIGAWPAIALINTVRSMLDRDVEVYINTNLIISDVPWEADLKDRCAHYIQTNKLFFV